MRWVYGCVYTSKWSFILNNFKLEELDLKTRGGGNGMGSRGGVGRESAFKNPLWVQLCRRPAGRDSRSPRLKPPEGENT